MIIVMIIIMTIMIIAMITLKNATKEAFQSHCKEILIKHRV